MTDKIFLKNPYLSEIDGRIIDKKYINDKYYITLNRTIFYPHLAGGQPRDKGKINGVDVIEVFEKDNEIIHVLNDNIYTDKVHLTIDWNNRFDLMQQHSGQHILSAAFDKLYNAETIGFYIGHNYVYIDVTLPKLNDNIIKKVEQFANKIISSNFDIKSYFIEKDNIKKIPLRKENNLDFNIRIVEIDGIDFSPCCGTHHRNTGEIGLVKIRNWEKYKGNTRIEFVCGNRALKDYHWKNKYINNIANLLSSKDLDVENKVRKLYYEKEKIEKDNRLLQKELLKYKAKELFEKSENYNGINIIKKLFVDLNFKDINFLSSLLTASNNNIVLLASKNQDKGQFILNRSPNLYINLKEIFKEVSKNVQIKGGGNSQTIQGGCSTEDLNKVLNVTYEICKTQIQ